MPRRRREPARETEQQFVLAGTVDARNSYDLASSNLETNVFRAQHASSVAHAECACRYDDCAGRAAFVTRLNGRCASDHRLGEADGVDRAHRLCEHGLTVTKDGDVVGDCKRLGKLVRDEYDGSTCVREATEHSQKIIGLTRCEDGGWLVEDQRSRAACERRHDLESLLRSNREVAGSCIGIELEPHELAHLAYAGAHVLGAIYTASAKRDVLDHGHGGNGAEVLVHHAQA